MVNNTDYGRSKGLASLPVQIATGNGCRLIFPDKEPVFQYTAFSSSLQRKLGVS
jgi:hypothetical protein